MKTVEFKYDIDQDVVVKGELGTIQEQRYDGEKHYLVRFPDGAEIIHEEDIETPLYKIEYVDHTGHIKDSISVSTLIDLYEKLNEIETHDTIEWQRVIKMNRKGV